jgi:flagella basal body P-ring formation protein FlgA
MNKLLLCVLLSLSSGVNAEALQSLASIDSAVKSFVSDSLQDAGDSEFTLGRLDPRLRLAACDSALKMRFSREPSSGGRNAVEVRCEGGRPWSIYVTVDVARFAEVVVSTRGLARGAVIGANDVVLARRRITSARLDYLSDETTAVGRVATRAIGPDQILGAANVMLPRLVKRGDEVTIASVGSAISVRVRGQALKDGGLGERVSVRNLNSKRVVEGVVNADGMVVVQSGAVL